RCRLYKVPGQICNTDQREHEPSYISIGPYHYQSEGLQTRSNLWKEQCVSEVKSLLSPPAVDGDAGVLLDRLMAGIEDEVRMYYDDIRSSPFPDNGEAFRGMMIADGCFLLVTLGLLQRPMRHPSRWDNQLWLHDILLYGNQLPFVVVREIYRLIRSCETRTEEEHGFPGKKIGAIIGPMLRGYTTRPASDVVVENAGHVLHLCHLLLKPTNTPMDNSEPRRGDGGDDDGNVERWRRATEYSELLVVFKKRELGGGAQCISDVKIRGRVVEIPKLELNPQTWRLLRNLVLLEQMNEHLGDHVTAYCVFISQIASTSADVRLLMERGIIVHWEATDEAAARKMGKLCDQITFYPGWDKYLTLEWHALESHCRSWSWRLAAKLCRHKDWKNPLVVTGTLVAVVILFCAIVQSLYSFLAYRDQK
uniref:Uncharacterized protein n=1 Tax=Oryza brachyantha TaxID=4533 RepID=J3N312_ORYBR